jgi:hypothetical protein
MRVDRASRRRVVGQQLGDQEHEVVLELALASAAA